MTKRLFLLVALFSISLAPMDAQPFAYITAEPSNIVVLNLANGNVATISTSDYNVNGIAFTLDGTRAVIAAGSSLLVISTRTNKVTANIRLGSFNDDNDVAVSPDGRHAYVTAPTSGTVWVVNLDNNTVVTTINVGGKPAGIAIMPDGSRVYVSGCGAFARSFCIINTANSAVTTTANIDYYKRFAITPDGTRLYAVAALSVVALNTATNARVATISLGINIIGTNIIIAPNGKYVYVGGLTMIAVIDASTNKVVATANASGLVAISPDGKHVYALDSTGKISVINTETNTVSGTIKLPQSVFFKQMAITPEPRQQPTFSAAGVVNAASFQGGGVAPGEIVTIFGSAIGPPTLTTMRLTSAGLVDNLLADTRVLFDGIPAPLAYVWQNQTSVIVPYAVAGKSTTQVQVEYKGLKSEPVTLRVVSAAPGIFTLDSSGKGQGAVLNENATVNSANNPALRGSIVVLYATGEGQTSPPGVDGKVASGVFPKPLLPVSVQIGGVPAEVLYAGAAPGLVAGVLQINVRVPLNGYLTVNPGNTVWVGFTIGNASSQQGVTIAIK